MTYVLQKGRGIFQGKNGKATAEQQKYKGGTIESSEVNKPIDLAENTGTCWLGIKATGGTVTLFVV